VKGKKPLRFAFYFCLLVLISFALPLALFARWNEFIDNQNNLRPAPWRFLQLFPNRLLQRRSYSDGQKGKG
jgi:hypothetical protein